MERREYRRINTDLNGTLFKKGVEIPVSVKNISEKGIGILWKNSECPVDFTVHKNERFIVVFYDEDMTGINTLNQDVQQCDFQICHVKKDATHTYIGGKLLSAATDYSSYVANKKANRFIANIRFMNFASA